MHELRPWIALIAQRRGRLLLGILLVFATLASAIGLLALSGWFITATGVTALLWAVGPRFPFDVYLPGGGIRFFALARTLARYGERLYNHDTVLRLLADLRTAHFAALARLDGATLARWRSAQWLNRLTADIDTLDTLYLRLLAPPIAAVLGSMLVGLLIMLHQPALGLSMLSILLLLIGLLTFGMARWGLRLSAARVRELEALRVQAVEQLQGLPELSAAGVLRRHQQVLLSQSADLLVAQRTLQWRVSLGQAAGNLGVLLGALLVLLACLLAVDQGTLSSPVAVMLALATLALGEGLAGLPAAFAQFGATRAAAARLNEQQTLRSTLANPAQPLPVPAGAGLHWDRVSVHYAGMHELELTLRLGERLSVIGPSGCGKSTLGALAARLIDPDQGTLRVSGLALTELDIEAWRDQQGYLTQQTDLLHDSIAVNLRLACPQASDEELWDVLALVELDSLVAKLPAQLDAWVGELGRQLSGGEGRRLALARVLLKNAPLVILDEPFSGLDAATRGRIVVRLDAWLAGRTALFLGHDPALLPSADRVLHWSQLARPG
jgi:ATP-binding cassette, subfamily C, bacterial CydC